MHIMSQISQGGCVTAEVRIYDQTMTRPPGIALGALFVHNGESHDYFRAAASQTGPMFASNTLNPGGLIRQVRGPD